MERADFHHLGSPGYDLIFLTQYFGDPQQRPNIPGVTLAP